MAPRRCALAVVLALVAALTWARAAAAHAALISAEPADGAVLSKPPATLKLTFNEPVAPLLFRLIGPGGEVLPASAAAKDATVTLTPPPLRQGTHVLSWRVISADGHPVGGSLLFSIGAPSARPQAGVSNSSDLAVRAALWVTKVLIYVGLFVGIGGAFFRGWIADAAVFSPRGWLIVALVTGVLAAVYSVSFQGLDALDLPLMDALDPSTWSAGLETSYGLTAVAAVMALMAGLASLVFSQRGMARALSLVGICGAAAALVLSGHAATAAPRLLTTPSVFVHVLCVALWVGAFVPLLAGLRAANTQGRALARFSRLIPYPLAALVLSGIALACVQLDRIDALWTTDYGRVLSGKLTAVLVLLGLAAANRYRLMPRFEAEGAADARRLRLSIAAELVIAMTILGLVGLWRFTPPPRAIAAAEPVSIHFHGGRAMAQIEVEPVRGRGAQVTVQVLDGEFRPLAAKEVTLVLSNPQAGIEPVRRTGTRKGRALWRIDDLRIPIGGRWRLRVEILIDDFDKVALDDDVELPPAP